MVERHFETRQITPRTGLDASISRPTPPLGYEATAARPPLTATQPVVRRNIVLSQDTFLCVQALSTRLSGLWPRGQAGGEPFSTDGQEPRDVLSLLLI